MSSHLYERNSLGFLEKYPDWCSSDGRVRCGNANGGRKREEDGHVHGDWRVD